MGLKIYTAPTSEPVTLAEAKLHLRVDIDDDNALITTLITAAREHTEMFTRRAWVNQTWDYTLDAFPPFTIEIPRSPLSSVTSITYTDSSGNSQTLSASAYTVDTDSEYGRVVPVYGTAWPATQGVPNAVRVRFVAGYGSTAASVPDRVKAAMKLLVGHWYENREAVVVGTITAELPQAVQHLLWGLKLVGAYS